MLTDDEGGRECLQVKNDLTYLKNCYSDMQETLESLAEYVRKCKTLDKAWGEEIRAITIDGKTLYKDIERVKSEYDKWYREMVVDIEGDDEND